MRALCRENEPSRLPEHARGRAWRFEGTYPITIGCSYPVAAMAIHEGVLVVEDWGGPLFAAAGFFEMDATTMPDDWLCELGPGNRAHGRDLWTNPVVAQWGYPELIRDPGHAEALLTGDPEALAVFARYAQRA
jgi:hypothetical protein